MRRAKYNNNSKKCNVQELGKKKEGKKNRTQFAQLICSYLSLNVIYLIIIGNACNKKMQQRKKKEVEKEMQYEMRDWKTAINGSSGWPSQRGVQCVLRKLLNMDEAIAVESMFMVINDRFELI